jgi:hypothetical protein
MNWRTTERVLAALVFAYALVLYVLTVAPATSFWDSGEFIAIANRLQVSHPPGAPFYMLVGRIFSMFVPVGLVALSVNLVSVLASAATVLLAHLIIVRLVREWQGAPSTWTTVDRIVALAGGAIGACTFAVTDSFWFNAVEAEVYALSMFFTAAVVWLILLWREQAEHEEAAMRGGHHPFGLAANRYLVLIAYFFGLAIGVHLLNLLAIFFVALIVFFVEFDREDWSGGKRFVGIVLAGLVSSVGFLVVYPGIIQFLPGVVGDSGSPVLVVTLILAAVAVATWYTHKRRMQALNIVALCVVMVLVGYSTYALIFIRSASDPPIDENDPETVEAIVSYLKREQYGATPILRGATFDNRTGQIDPATESWLPRRYSPEPLHMRMYARYDSDSEFFWKYQVGHMYLRYFLWNFMGRASDVQDAPAIVGLSERETMQYVYQTPSEHKSRNAYFGLPLLLGLVGAAFHFLRDWRRAFAVLVLFLVTGIGIVLYLNQTPMQPRERDYSYVASFFAFSLWVGMGGAGVIQLASEALRSRFRERTAGLERTLVAIAVVIFAAVPLLMAVVNFDDHDRSGRYVAGEYAYNMLMSVDENAILLTNGDNDTFPLWYMQEVEGVRQDVRVANLSLMNTSWYVGQLKNQASRTSEPLPISMPDDQVRDLTVIPWVPREITLPVNKDRILGRSEVGVSLEDSALIESPMRWSLQGRPYSMDNSFNLLYGADQVVFNMLLTNAQQDWKRPLYFAVTVSPDGQLDLQPFFQLEGQAYRVLPIRHEERLGRIVPEVTAERLRQFRFTGLADPDVYFDENIRRMVDNYRNVFSHTAERMVEAGYAAEARELLTWFHEQVPFETIPGDERSFLFMAEAFRAVGDEATTVEIFRKAEPIVLHRLASAATQRDLEFAAYFVESIRGTYMEAREFDLAAAFTERIADVLGDSSYAQTAEELRTQYEAVMRDVEAGLIAPDTLLP